MATLTLATPVRVGNLVSGVVVSSLSVASIKIDFSQPLIEVYLVDPSGFSHTVVLSGLNATNVLNALAAKLSGLDTQVLTAVATYLPNGTIS